MKFYIAAHEYEDQFSEVWHGFANSKEEAINQIAEECGVDEFEQYQDIEPFKDIWCSVDNHHKEIFEPLAKNDFKGFAKAYFKYVTVPNLWDVREFEIPEGKTPFVYAKDKDYINFLKDVGVVFAKDGFQAQNLILDEVAEKEAESKLFTVHVTNKTTNMSINEQLYLVDGFDAFSECNGERTYSPHVYQKYPTLTDIELKPVIDVHHMENVREFFKDKPEYGQEFLEYTYGGDYESNFSKDFYKFVAKKLIKRGKWVTPEVRMVELPYE